MSQHPRMKMQPVVDALRGAVPGLSAVYMFGSRASGDAGPESDLDLAILVDATPDPLLLWAWADTVADIAGCPVDLLDLRAASTVMQYRVITSGERLWARGSDAALYESFILSAKTELDDARAGVLEDIRRTGTIHG